MAAILAISFVSFALIGRVIIQYRTTGNHGIRLADPILDPVAALAGGTFVLSFAAGLAVVALDFGAVWAVPRAGGAWFDGIALFTGLSGVLIIVIAQLQMGSAWRIGVDRSEVTHLVTRGLYRRSRNPIYFGVGLYWVGLSALMPHPIVWLAALLCWISIEVIVRKVEEPYLRALHGTEFAMYESASNRYRIW